MSDLRGVEQRKSDVLAAMEDNHDFWLATADRPERVQAYRGYDELSGRDVMRDGQWLA